jgi:hypothetical protein
LHRTTGDGQCTGAGTPARRLSCHGSRQAPPRSDSPAPTGPFLALAVDGNREHHLVEIRVLGLPNRSQRADRLLLGTGTSRRRLRLSPLVRGVAEPSASRIRSVVVPRMATVPFSRGSREQVAGVPNPIARANGRGVARVGEARTARWNRAARFHRAGVIALASWSLLYRAPGWIKPGSVLSQFL